MAGYIGNKAVGLNVTTGDILGDVGVGGVLTTTTATVFNGGFGSSKASNVIAADGAAANAFAMQIHNLEATANQSFGLYIQAGSGSDQALKISDHDAANDLFALTGAGVATIKNGLTLTDGNLVVAAGHGIDFSAQSPTSASGASTTQELFSHYEEGTWTPNIAGRDFSSKKGNYTRIGNVVYVQYDCDTMSGGSVTNGSLVGLPFTCSNASSFSQGGFLPIPEPHGFTPSSGYSVMYFRVSKNGVTGQLLQSNGSTHAAGVALGNGANFRGSGFYYTDSG